MILAKFTKRERILIIATITIVLSTISYTLIIEPLIRTYFKLNHQIKASSLKLERNYKILKRQDYINTEYEKYSSLIKPSSSEEEEIASMLKVIEAKARENNIFITNIRPLPAKDKVYYRELTFELIAEAGIDRLVKFIYDLQTSGNLLRARKLTLTSSYTKSDVIKAVIEITKPSIKISKI